MTPSAEGVCTFKTMALACCNGCEEGIYRRYRRFSEQVIWTAPVVISQAGEWPRPSGNAQMGRMWSTYRLRGEHREKLREMRGCGMEEVRGHWDFPSLHGYILGEKLYRQWRKYTIFAVAKWKDDPGRQKRAQTEGRGLPGRASKQSSVITTWPQQRETKWWNGPRILWNLTSESSNCHQILNWEPARSALIKHNSSRWKYPSPDISMLLCLHSFCCLSL